MKKLEKIAEPLSLEEIVIQDECERDHLFFSRYFFKKRQNLKFIVNWHHHLICDVVDKIISGKWKNVVINVPPGSSKTELIVINLIARGLALNPYSRFLHLSYSDDLALLNSQTARELIRSEEFQKLWPMKISDDSSSKKRWNVEVNGKSAGGVYATSLSGQITGFRAGHMTGGFQGAIICFPYEQEVLTEKGFIPIGKIVREKMDVKVYSRNMDTGEIELKEIQAWNTNPESDIIEVNTNSGMSFKCTPDHLVWTETRGWVEAFKLLPSDILFSTTTECLPNYFPRDPKPFCGILMRFSTLIKSFPFRFSKIAISKITKMNNLGFLGNVFPYFSLFKTTYGNVTYPISFGNIDMRSRVSTNLQHFISRKFSPFAGIPSFIFPHSNSVFYIFLSRAVAKIRESVVAFNSVLVSNFYSWCLRTCKNLHHYLVNLKLLFSSRYSCGEVKIASRISTKSEYLASSDSFSKSTFVEDNSIKASSSAKVRDLISSLKTGKCNPDLIRFFRHDSSTYCLSVKDNSNFFVGKGQQAVLVSNCDDPCKPEDAFSKPKMNAANRRLLSTVKSRKATPDTPLILIMQRISENDPSGFIKGGNIPGEWHHVVIPAVIDQNYIKSLEPKYRKSVPHQEGDRFSYWPYKEPLPELLAMERGDGVDQTGSKISRYVFSAQYLQNPTAIGGNLIQGQNFFRYKIPPIMTHRYIFADTAQKTGERNDYSVFSLFGKGEDNRIYLLDLIRGKWEGPELKKRAIAFWVKHAEFIENLGQLRKLFVEDKSSGTDLIQSLRMLNNIPIDAIQRNKDKLTRMMDAAPYIESRMVGVPEDGPFVNDFITECEAFSPDMSHQHDDQVDTLMDAIAEMLSSKNSLEIWSKLSS